MCLWGIVRVNYRGVWRVIPEAKAVGVMFHPVVGDLLLLK